MKGDVLLTRVLLAVAVIVILLIVFGCADRRDMSRREATDIVDLSKELQK